MTLRRPCLAVTVMVVLSGCVADDADPGPADPTEPPMPGVLDCGDNVTYPMQLLAVRFEATAGAFDVLLRGDASPITVCHFLQYVSDDFYAGTIFHRICPGFVVQAGGQTADGTQKEGYGPIKNEAPTNNLSNVARTISMARTSEPDSADTHFFINMVDNTRLDPGGGVDEWGYAVFGNVTRGWDVVQQIEQTPTIPDAQGCTGRPVPGQEVTIQTMGLLG